MERCPHHSVTLLTGSMGDASWLSAPPPFLLPPPLDILQHGVGGLPEYPEPNFGTKKRVEWDVTPFSAYRPIRKGSTMSTLLSAIPLPMSKTTNRLLDLAELGQPWGNGQTASQNPFQCHRRSGALRGFAWIEGTPRTRKCFSCGVTNKFWHWKNLS